MLAKNREIPDITHDRKRELANLLAMHKSNQNIEEALRIYHPDIELVIPNTEIIMQGHEAVHKGLTDFFKRFPDYCVELNQFSYGEGMMFASGVAQATPKLNKLPDSIPVNRFAVPVCIEFYYRDDAIIKEVFHLDFSLAYRKSGIPGEFLFNNPQNSEQ